MENKFQDFVADPRLNRVIEALKRSNDIFRIIDLPETKHSDILKWLFDPREGHGQGDAIFKDFMMAAYANSDENVLSNKEFFSAWTPSRIARTGFHSLISIREYSLPNGCKLDLLMVDTINKILVVVENKHGAKVGKNQLPTYYDSVAKLKRRAFSNYETAYVVLDRYGGATEEAENRKAPNNRWAFMDYQWLEAGAHRAELQLKRGNQSAGLVIAYCQKQTNYVPPEEKEIDDILADVARAYRTVVGDLAAALYKRVGELTRGDLEGPAGEIWIFANNHPELIDRLQSKGKFSFIESQLRKELNDPKIVMYYGKSYFSAYTEKWLCINDDNDQCFPVLVSGWKMRDKHREETGAEKFAIAIEYHPSNLSALYKDGVHKALEAEFPELKKGRQGAAYRMLGKVTEVTEQQLLTRTLAVYRRLESALRPLCS